MARGDILLVEDDRKVAKVLESVLVQAGFTVTVAHGIRDALARNAERKASFDVVLADMFLQDGEGVRIIQAERARGGDAEIIVISGSRDIDTAIRALREGAYDYLEKPFRNADVEATVARAVEHRRVRRERDEARARALRAERNATLVQVAAGIAHEVKNPLQGMIYACTNLHMALDAPGLPAATVSDAREQVTLIEAEARRLRDLVEGVLDLARPAPRPVVEVDVGRLLAAVRSLHAGRLAATGGEVHVEAEPAVVVRVDEGDLTRAVDNMVRNAVEASPEGGSVWLRARRSPRGVEISVEDRGPGFNAEARAKAFHPFYTTRPRGFGLGLCQVAAAAERAGGEVEIQDAVPRGARVVLRIPITEAP